MGGAYFLAGKQNEFAGGAGAVMDFCEFFIGPQVIVIGKHDAGKPEMCELTDDFVSGNLAVVTMIGGMAVKVYEVHEIFRV